MTGRSTEFDEWLDWLTAMPVLSSHEHHKEAEQHQRLDLDRLLGWSYAGFLGVPANGERSVRSEWIGRVRFNTYYHWLEKALCGIYGFESLTADNWDEVSARIRAAHQADPDWHLEIMKRHGGYIGFLEDCYWNTGSDIGYPEFVSPVYRIDMWLAGFHPDSYTPEGTNPHYLFGDGPAMPFERYLERLEHELRSRRSGLAALKTALAYQRTIGFLPASREEAAAVFMKDPGTATERERLLFGDYMIRFVLAIAAELELPLQIHTGLAKLNGSNPMLLEPLLAAHPNNVFVLFHGGFPWIHETAGLAHNYGNVRLDINWLPLISTSAAVNALHMYADVLGSSEWLGWGGDAWTGEESVGAAMALRHALARVLSEKVTYYGWTVRNAEIFANKIMHENTVSVYRLRR